MAVVVHTGPRCYCRVDCSNDNVSHLQLHCCVFSTDCILQVKHYQQLQLFLYNVRFSCMWVLIGILYFPFGMVCLCERIIKIKTKYNLDTISPRKSAYEDVSSFLYQIKEDSIFVEAFNHAICHVVPQYTCQEAMFSLTCSGSLQLLRRTTNSHFRTRSKKKKNTHTQT